MDRDDIEAVELFILIVKDHCPSSIDVIALEDLLNLALLNYEDEQASK